MFFTLQLWSEQDIDDKKSVIAAHKFICTTVYVISRIGFDRLDKKKTVEVVHDVQLFDQHERITIVGIPAVFCVGTWTSSRKFAVASYTDQCTTLLITEDSSSDGPFAWHS